MMKYIFSVAVVLLIVPLITLAGPILRSGDSVSVEADQILKDDFYGFGSRVSLSGKAEEDVYIGGGSVRIDAPVEGDLTIAGGTVHINAEVGDDLRILAGEVVLTSNVVGDVVVIGGVFDMSSKASVGGDVLFLAGDVELSGPIEGSILGSAEVVRIDTSVGGDVSLKVARSLTLGDRTEILGNLEYSSPSDIARAQGAVIVGDIQQKEGAAEDNRYIAIFIPVLILLFASLITYVLFRKYVQTLVAITFRSYGMQGLVGLAMILVLPALSVLLMASVLGALVGFVLLFTIMLLYIGALVCSGAIVGTFILKPITKSTAVTLYGTILGTILFALLPLVPFVGPLVMFGISMIVLGGFGMHMYRLITAQN